MKSKMESRLKEVESCISSLKKKYGGKLQPGEDAYDVFIRFQAEKFYLLEKIEHERKVRRVLSAGGIHH